MPAPADGLPGAPLHGTQGRIRRVESFAWHDDLSVGIEEIDEQHKVLVGLVQRLDHAIRSQHGSTECASILHELVNYTVIHFAVEESLMRLMNYPGYDAHKAAHGVLVRQVVQLKAKVDAGHTNISFELLHFLRQWLVRHIQGDDKDYAPWFLEHGIQPTLARRSWLGRVWHSVHG